jgi:hypothetical protein
MLNWESLHVLTFFVVVSFCCAEDPTQHMLGKCSATELQLQPMPILFIEIRKSNLFVMLGF